MKTIFSLCFALLSSQGVFSGGGSSSSGSRSYEYSYERHGDQHHDYAYRHSTFCKRELSSLRLLIGVFRHGDKTPDTTFPTDIYQDESWPNGFGQLTMGGVERSFELGRWMRFCYDSFLHKRVSPKRLYVRSSDYDRTLQSAQAVLAGAYPPTASYQIGSAWGETCAVKLGRFWQPYSVHTVPVEIDTLLRGHMNCPRYDQLLRSIHHSSETLHLLHRDAKFLKKIVAKSGMKTKDLLEIIDVVQSAVLAEIENGRRPVKWLSKEYDIERLAFYRDFIVSRYFRNAELTKIVGGRLLKEIIERLLTRAGEKSDLEHVLFSGHSLGMEALLASLGVFDSIGYHEPPYGSAVFFELHQLKDGSHAVATFYRNSSSHDPMPLAIPGCESFVEDSWSSESRSSSEDSKSIGASEPNSQLKEQFRKMAQGVHKPMRKGTNKKAMNSDEDYAVKRYKALFRHGRKHHKHMKRNVLCRLRDFKRLMMKKASHDHEADCKAKEHVKKHVKIEVSKSGSSEEIKVKIRKQKADKKVEQKSAEKSSESGDKMKKQKKVHVYKPKSEEKKKMTKRVHVKKTTRITKSSESVGRPSPVK